MAQKSVCHLCDIQFLTLASVWVLSPLVKHMGQQQKYTSINLPMTLFMIGKLSSLYLMAVPTAFFDAPQTCESTVIFLFTGCICFSRKPQ